MEKSASLGKSSENDLPVFPEIEKLKGLHMLCFCGADDPGTLCKDLDPGLIKTVILKGGHRIGKNVTEIADAIAAAIKKK